MNKRIKTFLKEAELPLSEKQKNNLLYSREKTNNYEFIEPIKSIEEFEMHINMLESWQDKDNMLDYYKILIQVIMLQKGYSVELELSNGLRGEFKGVYSNNLYKCLLDILSKKFPTDEECFQLVELSSNDVFKTFLYYLGNFNQGKGASLLFERSPFEKDLLIAGYKYQPHKKIDDIAFIENQANEYINNVLDKTRMSK